MPSPATLADQGFKALTSQNYSQAIELYTQALQQTPESPDYYLKRSTAYQRSSNYRLALRDAELAVVLAHKRGKRELIASAQLRRGISLLMEGKLGDAGFCFSEAEQKAGSEKDRNLIGVWKSKLGIQLARVHEDDASREVTVKEIPDVEVPKAVISAVEGKKGNDKVLEAEKKFIATTVSQAPDGVTTPPSKIRHEWYQTATHVVLTIYVKGVPKDKASIGIKEKSVSISFPLPSGNEFTFDLDPLYHSVTAEESTYTILTTKIEVKLTKSSPGQKWPDLEPPDAPDASKVTAPTILPMLVASTEKSKVDKPVYPTSSKSGPKDWDKLAKELTARPKIKAEDTNEKQSGNEGDTLEYDSDYEGGDPVNHFFKKLYKDADEDTRRAMMKSYVESNGTALSTNWKEVGKAPVETSPPDGMVAQRWAD